MKLRSLWLLMALAATVAGPIRADDDDDDNAKSALGPDLQWQLANSAWNRREYDDAAALNRGFAEQNPNDPNALEAIWRTYQVYRNARPNEARRKAMFDLLGKEAVRWARAYATSDKNRAAAALYLQAQANDQELGHPAAMIILQDMLKRFPDSSNEFNALWQLGEWSREAKKYEDAAGFYHTYSQKSGVTDAGALNVFREGWMKLELKDVPGAVALYKQVVNGDYNWGWGQVHWGTVEAAERLKAAGEDKTAREFALKVMDKMPGREDIAARARNVLGQGGVKRVTIYPHMIYRYTTDKVSISPQTKLTLEREMPVLVRLTNISKTETFNGTLSITPKYQVVTAADNMTKSDAGGKPTYTANIVAPDEKGGINGDWWYRFTETPHAELAPDDLTVTRTWKAAGAGWGECTIRIQTKQRWYVYVTLPNTKTNVNNISGTISGGPAVQPNDILDGGKTFRWYDWYDLSQGMTLKFPIEAGADLKEYYPQVRLERNIGRYANTTATGKDAAYDMAEYAVKLSSANDFPYSFEFHGNMGASNVLLSEVKK